MFKNLNFPSTFVLIIYPLLLISLLFYYASSFGLGSFELLLFIAGYYISNITVGIGLHRLWSHDSYKTNKYVEFVLMLLAAGTLQGPTLSWASNHFRHHTYTDEEEDPHSPLKYKSKFMGFFWSHMGWMLVGEGSYKSIDKITMTKLGKNRLLRWQLKYYWQIALAMNTIVPAFVGYLFGGKILAAFAGFIFIGLGRVLQQQITFFVNSLCHFVGEQPYTKGTARDIWWLALLLLGENWHNFHHAFPSDYRNGEKWYHFDVHKWIIFLMSKCGLAWDLKRTTKVRVEAKIIQTVKQLAQTHKENIEKMQIKANKLYVICQQKLQSLENSSMAKREKFWEALLKTQDKLMQIKFQLQEQVKSFENSSEQHMAQVVIAINKKVKKIEQSLQKIYKEIEAIT